MHLYLHTKLLSYSAHLRLESIEKSLYLNKQLHLRYFHNIRPRVLYLHQKPMLYLYMENLFFVIEEELCRRSYKQIALYRSSKN